MSEPTARGRRPRDCSIPRTFTPLALETRSHVNTDEAAAHLLLKPQTLRRWAMRENGPIRPVRVGVRLMWPVSEIRRVLFDGQISDQVVTRAQGAAGVRLAEWEEFAICAICALEKWERAAKIKDRDAMDAARKTRDAVLRDFRAKTGGAK